MATEAEIEQEQTLSFLSSSQPEFPRGWFYFDYFFLDSVHSLYDTITTFCIRAGLPTCTLEPHVLNAT